MHNRIELIIIRISSSDDDDDVLFIILFSSADSTTSFLCFRHLSLVPHGNSTSLRCFVRAFYLFLAEFPDLPGERRRKFSIYLAVCVVK